MTNWVCVVRLRPVRSLLCVKFVGAKFLCAMRTTATACLSRLAGSGLVCGAVLVSSLSLAAQSSNPDSSGGQRPFQSKVGVVLVDTVVTDHNDQPVGGLKSGDFEILEDGKRQTISSFEEHKVSHTPPAKLPPMPPGVYTNFPVATSDSINVLLLDTVNTEVPDQSYVRAQLIRYLKGAPAGTRLAVFVLGMQLRMIQPVTTDAAVLLAALNNPALGSAPQQSPMLITKTESDSDKALNEATMQDLAAETQSALQAMQHRGIAYMNEFKLDVRIQTTLQALQNISRYLAAFPGRKNLIWFSGSFPIGVFPDLKAADAFEAVREYRGQTQKTADLLALAQVAIYPIAAEGVVWDTEYEADASEISRTRASSAAPHLSNAARLNFSHFTMEVLAENSGGKAFYDTNGLTDALARAVNYGSHYYTLAYTTSNRKLDGGYRRIQVKLSPGNYKLAYRRGYYADDPSDAKARKGQKTDVLMPLMTRGLPEMAQILYKVRVAPSEPQPAPAAPPAGDNKEMKRPYTRYGVDFAVDVDDLHFEPSADGVRSGDIEIMLVVYDQVGKSLNFLIRKRAIDLKPEVFAAAQKVGLQLHYDIDVPQGGLSNARLYLRTGICNLRTADVGTLEVPLEAVTAAEAPAK